MMGESCELQVVKVLGKVVIPSLKNLQGMKQPGLVLSNLSAWWDSSMKFWVISELKDRAF